MAGSRHTPEGFFSDLAERVELLERRAGRGGGGGGGGGSATGVPAGTVLPWAGAGLPANALWAEGQAVSRSGYATLFATIGTTYGAGDGSTTFNVPDMRGRVPVGLDPSQPEFDALGEAGGAKTHTLTQAQSPYKASSSEASGFGLVSSTSFANRVAVTNGSSATSPHNNLQPYRVLRYIITTAQVDLPGDSMLATRVGDLEADIDLLNQRPQGVLPSSVSVGSGSASVAADGRVTFTGASSVSLNDIFDGLGSDAYEISAMFTATAGGAICTRVRAGGVDDTASAYNYVGNVTRNASGPTRYSTFGLPQFGHWWPNSDSGAAAPITTGRMRVYSPTSTGATWVELSTITGASDRFLVHEAGDRSGVHDGLTIHKFSGGTISGWIKVVKI